MVFVVAVSIRAAHFTVPVRSPDESAYFFYAKTLYERGPEALPHLVRQNTTRPDKRNYPSPTRVGHLWLEWGAMLLMASPSLEAAAAVSFAASTLLLLLVWRIGTSFLTAWVAPVAMLFLATSPMDLAMSRRLWGDEPFGAAVAAMALCFLEYARSRRAGWAVGYFACAIAATLIKETALFFFALGTLGLMVLAWREGSGRRASVFAVGGLTALFVALAIQAAACGGWEPVREAVAGAARAQSGNEYMRKYQTGGWDYYVRGLGILQPIPIVLGFVSAIGSLVLVIRRSARRPASVVLSIAVLAFMALAVFYPQKNLRFLSPVYSLLFLLAGLAVVSGVAWLSSRFPSARRAVIGAAIVALVAIALFDHARFLHYFIRRGILDLATPWFVK